LLALDVEDVGVLVGEGESVAAVAEDAGATNGCGFRDLEDRAGVHVEVGSSTPREVVVVAKLQVRAVGFLVRHGDGIAAATENTGAADGGGGSSLGDRAGIHVEVHELSYLGLRLRRRRLSFSVPGDDRTLSVRTERSCEVHHTREIPLS